MAMRISRGLLLGLLTTPTAVAFADPALVEYLDWSHAKAGEQVVELHYTDHRRGAFEIVSDMGQLRFDLNAPHVGMTELRPRQAREGLVTPGSLSMTVTTAGGEVYETRRAARPARINLFRHGPHYIDAHVFDLIPTDDRGRTLPVRGELRFHVWADRLYVEAKLHPKQQVSLASAALNWNLDAAATEHILLGIGAKSEPVATPVRVDKFTGKDWIGFVGRGQALAFSIPAPNGTKALAVNRADDQLRVIQHFDVNKGNLLFPGQPVSAAMRLHVNQEATLDDFAHEVAVEATPLTQKQFNVGPGAVFSGYNARAGYYTIGTARRESLRWLYEHPEAISTAPISLRNGGLPRTIAIRHENTVSGGRLGAGVLTDTAGQSLPILVQNSKNFRGENEEPFYDPGDPEYNETYFLLPLRAGENLNLQSHLTFQGWGNHPIKQVGSLQAWMHYYQMSLGVTETTCHVPFRFGGHGGIWIADLRGISGRMWPGRGQPQFDNVGGHRIFHYRHASGEYFTRYLRTRFRSTGPNLADWSMDFVSERGEARVSVDICEPPQTDVTRCFTKMRVEFDRPLRIDRARENLRLISLDTSQQRLRYDQFGYTDSQGEWRSVNPKNASLPLIDRLTHDAPLVALSGNRRDSHQEGNNAILVRSFCGSVGGRPLEHLAVGLDKRKGSERITWISPDADVLEFGRGDFLELDFVVIPFGREGDGPKAALAERQRYGTDSPKVVAEVGRVLNYFPARVVVSKQGRARFQLEGGFGVMPVLIEGFENYDPPRLEQMRDTGVWDAVVMGNGRLGHHSYRTPNGKYGFVFLVEADGSPIQLRIGDPAETHEFPSEANADEP